MKLFRAVCVSTLLLTVPAIGQTVREFTPRTPVPKNAVVEKPALATGRLIVKFQDQVQARIRNGQVHSTTGATLDELSLLTQNMNLVFRPLFGDKSEISMRLVEMRAAAYSGKAQPDLAGMMYVDVPSDMLDAAAARLNALPIVEYCEYDQEWVSAGPPPDPSCGDSPNSCFAETMVGEPFCDDLACCTQVCGIYPFCCDEDFGEWNAFCADLANMFCGCEFPCYGGPGADRCNAPFLGGGCFDTHPFGGCNNSACCTLVCDLEPFCCFVEWDEMCRNIASANCEIDAPGVTPDFSEFAVDPNNRLQQYRTAAGTAEFAARTGFDGQGWDLAGMWEVGELLIDLGIADTNLSNGMGIRVGIVEHSAHVATSTANGHAQTTAGHEDLATVICEPGQTPFKVELGNISANHGTATLGIAVAEDNNIGVIGIARHAQGYFFPIVSQEAGGRLQAAILSALEEFEPGDVLSYSIGPGGCGTLVSSQANWTLFRLASDLGITSCIAAGNDCCNLDDNGQAGGEDCGAIIVGACWPGAPDPLPPGFGPFCRLGFSNHCQECEDAVGLVHVSAWGINVCTTGYGDLSGAAGDNNRHYTAGFNGTSAACPQIAGLAACLQGIAKMMYGIPLMPEQIRGIIASAVIPQCGFQNPQALPGAAGSPCGGDWDFDEEPNFIVGYPEVVGCAANVLSATFFDAAPGVRDIELVYGTHVFGNLFSIKATDNNYYIIDSERRVGGNGSSPSGHFITYLGQGHITDVIVTAKSDNPQPTSQVAMAGNLYLETTGPVIMFIEFFNWRTGRFDRWGFQFFAGQGVGQFQAAPPATTFPRGQYVRSSDGMMQVRVWTLGFTGQQGYRVFYDFINLAASANPGPNPGTGP